MTDRAFINDGGGDGSPINIRVTDKRFAHIGAETPPTHDVETIDLQGDRALPGFIDAHIHPDQSVIGDRWHPHRPATSLQERLTIENRRWPTHARPASAPMR